MDEKSIEHWIGQLDKQRDNLIIAMSHYKKENARIPINTEKIEEEAINVQQWITNLEFAIRRLKEEAYR